MIRSQILNIEEKKMFDPQKIQQLKIQQQQEAEKMNKFKGWVDKKKNKIAEIGNKIVEEQGKI